MCCWLSLLGYISQQRGTQQLPFCAGGGVTTQFGGPVAAALFVLWLGLAFLGWILALAGLSALQNKIYKESNAVGAAP